MASHLRPCLANMDNKNALFYQHVVYNVSPALYLAHKNTAFDDLEKLYVVLKDHAYSKICNVIKTKTYPNDSHETRLDKDYALKYTEISDICELIERMSEDSQIVWQIQDICLYLGGKKSRYHVTDAQKQAIVQRLKSIIENNLPDNKNIRHEGYKILALAFVEHSYRRRGHVFEELIKDAQSIENNADKAFVLFKIGTCLPGKKVNVADDLYDSAITLIEKIPSTYDRASRYRGFAEELQFKKPTLARECIDKAMRVGIPRDDPSLHDVQRSLVDIAYRIDPNYASAVASTFDDDTARVASKIELEEKLRELELKNEVLKDSHIIEEQKTREYPRIAWKLLGALNSKRIVAKRFNKYTDMIRKCSAMPITEAYPVFAFAIENANVKYQNKPQALEILRPLFEGTVLGTELAWALTSHSISQFRKIAACDDTIVTDSHLFVEAGQRDKALDFIESWMKSTLEGYLKICDPFFGPEDLDILKMVISVNPNCEVSVLTSRKHQKMIGNGESLEDNYRSHWRKISDQDPPYTEIIIVGLEQSGEPPIHDRWLLSERSGLRLGTSLNSLGIKKDAELSLIGPSDVDTILKKADPYFSRRKKKHCAGRLLYSLFSL